MKRDMNLARALLAKIESDDRLCGSDGFAAHELEMSGHSEEDVAFHVLLLLDAGLIAGNSDVPSMPIIERLTWQGCEFLDDTRDPEIWDKAKKRVQPIASAGVALVWEIAKAELKQKLGLK